MKPTPLLLTLLLTTLLLPALTSCHDTQEWDNNPTGNFDALWTTIDTRYCFLDEKEIDWQETGNRYRSRIDTQMSQTALFELCAEMLDELKDGHVNLSSRFDTSYYRQWWTDYPQDFNLRTIQQYYLQFDYWQTSGIIYKVLPGGIGYIYYPSFSTPISDSALNWILSRLSECRTLVIDIRNNGGGLLTNIETLVSRFIDKDICGGYICHKTGPGHNDFSEPRAITYHPASSAYVHWDKPIKVLTNRSCYSAANDFVAVMKSLPRVKIIGARTGGGGGLPFTSELPNGWSIRFSACPITAPDGKPTEYGIDPSPGCEVHCTDADLADGHDAILDFAMKN